MGTTFSVCCINRSETTIALPFLLQSTCDLLRPLVLLLAASGHVLLGLLAEDGALAGRLQVVEGVAVPGMLLAAGLAAAVQPGLQAAEVVLHQRPRGAVELVRRKHGHSAAVKAGSNRGLAC